MSTKQAIQIVLELAEEYYFNYPVSTAVEMREKDKWSDAIDEVKAWIDWDDMDTDMCL